MPSSVSWWVNRARQFRAHLRATVTSEERAALATRTTSAQLALFDAMHVADRRHGLLLHDAGKGQTGVWPRVAYTLGQRYGHWIWRVAGLLPGYGHALE